MCMLKVQMVSMNHEPHDKALSTTHDDGVEMDQPVIARDESKVRKKKALIIIR